MCFRFHGILYFKTVNYHKRVTFCLSASGTVLDCDGEIEANCFFFNAQYFYPTAVNNRWTRIVVSKQIITTE